MPGYPCCCQSPFCDCCDPGTYHADMAVTLLGYVNGEFDPECRLCPSLDGGPFILSASPGTRCQWVYQDEVDLSCADGDGCGPHYTRTMTLLAPCMNGDRWTLNVTYYDAEHDCGTGSVDVFRTPDSPTYPNPTPCDLSALEIPIVLNGICGGGTCTVSAA